MSYKGTSIKEKIQKSLELLKTIRPIYHSEDDFKFSFSKVLQEELGKNYTIRLERPEEISMLKRDGSTKVARAPIDIIVINKITSEFYPIELKYKTKKYETIHQGEKYKLTEQGATDIGRFSFRKGIYRIEQLLKHKATQGFFIVITNENKYLQNISNKDTLDKNFSFHNNVILSKEDKSWNYKKQLASGYSLNNDFKLIKNNKLHWTSTGDEFYKLNLRNTYEIKWETYSKFENTEMFIAIVEIRQQNIGANK